MALILSIETATRNCSVALSRDGQVIAFREVAEQGYTHAEKLHVFIEEVMQEAGVSLPQLDAVAVSKGPGSYTGLRIGVSAAKGLCYALQISLIAVDTLAVLAHSLNIESGYVLPMLDARRMEVYAAIYDAQKKEVQSVKAEILDAQSFSKWSGPIYVIGDSNEKAKTVITDSRFYFIDDLVFPSAKILAVLATDHFKSGIFEDVAYFEPFYLKDFRITNS